MADGSHGGQKEEEEARPRIAYSGEERGFGADATIKFVERALRGQINKASAQDFEGLPPEIRKRGYRRTYNFAHPISQPLRTKEQALMAVKADTADFAIVPFYHPHYGYDRETLRALASQLTLFGVEQITSETEYVLAVYEPQVLDFVQSSHPGSTLSTIMTGAGKHLWSRTGAPGVALTGVHKLPDNSGFMASPVQQAMLRDRVESVFASPVAARACKSKLDGLRQAGVNVEETLESIEPHRDFARRVRDVLDHTRQTSTTFDFTSGESRIQSVMPSTQAQARKLYGIVIPREIAQGPEYIIIDEKFADADPAKTRFMVVRYAPDPTLLEDAYRTTDARTRYWIKRLERILGSEKIGGRESAALLALAGLVFSAVGGAGLAGWSGIPFVSGSAELVKLADAGALAIGVGLFLVGFWKLLSIWTNSAQPKQGLRLLLSVSRAKQAASTGDIEDFLRYFKVRHRLERIDEDSEREEPASSVLDIEFMPDELFWNPTRRLRGSIVNGALKKAFAGWKSRGVLVLAAMPFAQPQMPPHERRHWLWDVPGEWIKDFSETMFIRLSRILFYLLPVAAAAYGAWVLMGGGK